MKTRRSFLAGLAAMLPAVWLGRKALAAEADPVVKPNTNGPQIGEPYPMTSVRYFTETVAYATYRNGVFVMEPVVQMWRLNPDGTRTRIR